MNCKHCKQPLPKPTHVTKREAAKMVGVCERIIYEWINNGLLVPELVKGSKLPRIKVSDIEEVIRRREV